MLLMQNLPTSMHCLHFNPCYYCCWVFFSTQDQREECERLQQQWQDNISKQSTKAANKHRQNEAKKLQQNMRAIMAEAAEVQRDIDMFESLRLAWEDLHPGQQQQQHHQESSSSATFTGSKQQQLVQGSNRDFDPDSLLQGMLQAAGMTTPISSGGDFGVGSINGGDSEVWLDPMLDELLLGGSDSDDEDEVPSFAAGDLGDVLDAEFEPLPPSTR
jgi:hypothetical protein